MSKAHKGTGDSGDLMMMTSPSREQMIEWGGKRIRSAPRIKASPLPVKKRSKLKKRSYDRTTCYGDFKDVCICIRLEFEVPDDDNRDDAKWLRVKIPAILLHKRGGGSPDDDDDDDDDADADADCFRPFNTDSFFCDVDPINGPFAFPSLVGTYDGTYDDVNYPTKIRCAPLGSLMFALGADPTDVASYQDILFQATFQVRLPKFEPNKAGTGGPSSVRPPSRNRSITTSFHASHRLHFCDFSKQNPQWEISPQPLISPRVWPKLVSIKGKIYAFGGNLLTDDQSPFAEVFDPDIGSWNALPEPPFGKLADCELFVFPLHNSSCILLIGIASQAVYTFNTSSWCWSPFRASTHLCDLLDFRGWFGLVDPVISGDRLYWIDQRGRLCAYILKGKGHYFVGPISVFKGDEYHCFINKILKATHDYSYSLALLPISQDLLGLLWCDMHFAFGCLRCGSTLHISILHVSLHNEINLENTGSSTDKDPVLSLTASSVACICFPFLRDNVSVIDAYLIDDDKESWQLMSSCSSYRTIDDMARY